MLHDCRDMSWKITVKVTKNNFCYLYECIQTFQKQGSKKGVLKSTKNCRKMFGSILVPKWYFFYKNNIQTPKKTKLPKFCKHTLNFSVFFVVFWQRCFSKKTKFLKIFIFKKTRKLKITKKHQTFGNIFGPKDDSFYHYCF